MKRHAENLFLECYMTPSMQLLLDTQHGIYYVQDQSHPDDSEIIIEEEQICYKH
jgi:hypothetical protein